MQTVREIRAGQTATFATGDGSGWMRRPVPADGILIEGDETTVFVPTADVVRCLESLGYVVVPAKTAVTVAPTVAARKGRRK